MAHAAWLGEVFEIEMNWPHTKSLWYLMKLPEGENGEGPGGWLTAPKEDCMIVSKPKSNDKV